MKFLMATNQMLVICVCGCSSYAHIAKDESKKLDRTTKRCVLVGYGTEVKGYRLYDPVQDKVLYCRDVRWFNEDHSGIEKEPCAAEPVKYVELESSDEGTEPVNDQVSDSSTIGDMDQSPLSLRRSENVRRRPDYYIEGTSVASQDLDEPCTF